MAEIETRKPSSGVNRMKKKNTRVDLTPMVDLGFLLITFFVFTTAMMEPKVMGLNEPIEDSIIRDRICNSCALAVFLEEKNRISYYEGMPENDPPVGQTSFTVNGIRRILSAKKEKVRKELGDAGRFVLIIKPGDGSTMQNFVDMMDEVAINEIVHYYISEINAADKKLLGRN